MNDPIITNNSSERAVTTNYFLGGKRYAYRINDDGHRRILEFRIDSGSWKELALPQDVRVTNVAADNNRVFVRVQTSKGDKLYWRCLKEDSANWVVLLLWLAEFIGDVTGIISDVIRALIRDAIGGTPLKESIWKLIADNDDKKWIEDKSFSDLASWAAAYREWVHVTHNPDRLAPPSNHPYLKENGWNSLEQRKLPLPDGYAIDDIAVGHWNNTVVTYYVLAHVPTASGHQLTSLFFLDEEPIMHAWEAVPDREGEGRLHLDSSSRISASHSVVAAITGNKRPHQLQWMRIDAHRPGHVDVWPLNWTESWSDDLHFVEQLRLPFPGATLPIHPRNPVEWWLLLHPPLDVLNAVNYPGWHSVSVDVEAVSGFIIDVGRAQGPWPVPKPDRPILSPLWWINLLVTTYSAAIDVVRGKPGGKDVGFLGDNPIRPNYAYPVCCIVESGTRHLAFAIPDASKTGEIEWKDARACQDVRAVPPAGGDAFGYVTPFDNTARVLYRGLLGAVHELYLPPGGYWTHADLTQLAGAPPAAGDAFGYVTPFDNTARVLYRGLLGAVHELYLPPGGHWTHADLTLLAGAPAAAGTPTGYVTPDKTARVVYTAMDRSIHELYLQPGGHWTHADLTLLAGAPAAAGTPTGYVTPDKTARVLYRGLLGAVHELYLPPGGYWTHAELTQLAGAPPAAGDAFGYVTPFDNTARVLYRGLLGAVHELYLPPGGHWTHAELTQLAGAPPAAGDAFGYVTSFDNTARVLYRGLLGAVHELYLQPGGRWTGTILPP